MGRKMDSRVLVIDVESTCWEEPEKTAASEAGEISEIIEIGITVVDTRKLAMVENASILIKPQTSKVSNFCTRLTTLTQEQVDGGIAYQQATNQLVKQYQSNNRLFVSWGDYDRKMFERNCRDFDVKYPFGPRHLNLKSLFTVLHGLDNELGMDSALQHLGLKLEGTHHRGNDDARNIARIFLHTIGKFRGIEL
jgi:inhibitor of KinA sporulation pathway (predicted exonuclease)